MQTNILITVYFATLPGEIMNINDSEELSRVKRLKFNWSTTTKLLHVVQQIDNKSTANHTNGVELKMLLLGLPVMAF